MPRTILIISQVYVPDPAAVGQYIAHVAENLAKRGWRVLVYTSARGYDDPDVSYRRRETRNGVEIYRLPFSSFGKASLAMRLMGQLFFLAQALLCGLVTRRLSRVLVSTSPPFAGAAGALISSVRRLPFVWWVMDLNPDQLVASKLIHPRALAVRVFELLNRWTMKKASAIVVLDRHMRERIRVKLPVAEKVHIIPPWPLDNHQTSLEGANEFRVRHGLGEAFVVMYSGNHSPQNPLNTLLEVSRRFASNPRVRFVFVGGGIEKVKVEELIAQGARNIVSIPYQPLNAIGDSLSAADLHVVSIGNDMVGIVHPCKIYGAMAIGKPILLFGPMASHAGDIVGACEIGWQVDHGDVDKAERVINEAIQMDYAGRIELGNRAKAIIAERYSAKELCQALVTMLEQSSN